MIMTRYVACPLLALGGGLASAGEIHVGPGESIQEAIDVASDGDEIIVAPGDYERIDFKGKELVVRSTGGPTVTTIDGGGAGTVVTMESGNGASSILEGFTVSGGTALNGPGLSVEGESPTMIDCRFVDHSGFNGVLYVEDGQLVMIGCTIGANQSGGDTGGLNIAGESEVMLTDCEFRLNTANTNGGAVHHGGQGALTVLGCVFDENLADEGGAIYSATAGLRVIGCTFMGNRNAIYAGADAVISGCTFDKSQGYAVRLLDWSGRIDNCRFGIGDAPTVTVQGIGSRGEIANCSVLGTIGDGTGAVEIFGTTSLTGCTIAGSLGNLAGVRLGPVGSPPISNCVIWSHGLDAMIGGNGMAMIAHSLLEGSGGSGPDWNASLGIDGGGNVDVDPMIADLVGPDALPGSGDESLQLLAGSPCIDAGDSTLVPADVNDLDGDGDTKEPLPVDLIGEARFVDDGGTPDTGVPDGGGRVVDMGAVEFPGSCVDTNGDGVVDVLDLVVVTTGWGSDDPDADVDGDGVVGISDLIAIILGWGPCS